MSPESARPVMAGTSMPGFQRSRSLAFGPASRWANGPDHPEHVCHGVLVGVAELAHRLVQRRRQRAPQRLVGARFELAGPPVAAYGGRAQRVEQHGLADTTQASEHADEPTRRL